MSAALRLSKRGFTLVELLTALLILALLALMSFRGLGAVLDARDHVRQESDKWRRVGNFLARLEHDAQLAAPRPVRSNAVSIPSWRGRAAPVGEPSLEFSRFGTEEGADAPRRLAYLLNDRQEIELWLWPGLDLAPGVSPERFPVLAGVASFGLKYLDADLAWVAAWPGTVRDAPIPRAMQLRLVLVSGEEIVRVFALRS